MPKIRNGLTIRGRLNYQNSDCTKKRSVQAETFITNDTRYYL